LNQIGLFVDQATPAPVIVNLGLGVDSVARLVGLHQRGETPDLILFADTGGEKPDTYAYLDVIGGWLAAVGFPTVTVVRRPEGRSGYRTLEGNCLKNETLPSLAFGMKGCSLKWKAEAMDHFLLGRRRGHRSPGWALAVAARDAGKKPIKLIGYDAGPKDSRRAVKRTEDDHFVYRYPLREWGWARERCIDEISAAGLPVPVKSACFFCPASQEWELYWLAARHPELLLRALAMEDQARDGKHGLHAVKGLWGRKAPRGVAGDGSWRSWAEANAVVADDIVVRPATDLMERAMELKPPQESNGDGTLYRIGDSPAATRQPGG
jgi:hypothetical protein